MSGRKDEKRAPKVVVIVPVYKVEAYLEKCVESVKHQKYSNLKIILVDDGSPDRSPEICDKLAEEYSNIKVIHKENGGLSSARNAGLDLIEKRGADYVLFLDSDDTMPEGTIYRLVKIAEKEQADIVLPDRYNYVDENKKTQQIRYHFPKEMYETNPKQFACEVIIKKARARRAHSLLYSYKIIEENNIRFPIGRISEDIVFNLQFMKYANKMVIIPYVTVNYLKRKGSITTTYQPDFENDIWYIDCCVKEFLIDIGMDEEAVKEYSDTLLARNIIIYLFCIFSIKTKLSEKEKEEKAKMIISHKNSRNVIREKHEKPWFESKKSMYGYLMISMLLRHKMDKMAFAIMKRL